MLSRKILKDLQTEFGVTLGKKSTAQFPEGKHRFFLMLHGELVPCATDADFDAQGNLVVVILISQISDIVLKRIAEATKRPKLNRHKVDVMITNANRTELVQVLE